jgi:hypothetical protein
LSGAGLGDDAVVVWAVCARAVVVSGPTAAPSARTIASAAAAPIHGSRLGSLEGTADTAGRIALTT